MRLLFISQLFDPEYSIKGLGFLKKLNCNINKIDVITTFPNYPTGKVFDGYKIKLWDVEYKDNIRIIRVYSYISHSKSKLARAYSYLTFAFFAFIASIIIKRPNLLYAYHPQISIGMVAILIRLFKKVPFITDIQDLWPESLVATGLSREGKIYNILERLNLMICKKSCHIVVLSKGFKSALISKGILKQKITVVYNWHAKESISLNYDDYEKSLLPSEYKYHFVYAGNVGSAQCLHKVVDAFNFLSSYSVCLCIIGTGVDLELIQNYVRDNAIKNIYFLGYIHPDSLNDYLSQADVLLVHLKNDPLFKITIPSKTQACLSSGKPVLMAVGGEANQIVLNAKAGDVAEPEDVLGISNAAINLIKNKKYWKQMGNRGRSYYLDFMSQEVGAEKISNIVNNCLLSKSLK